MHIDRYCTVGIGESISGYYGLLLFQFRHLVDLFLPQILKLL